MPPSGLVNTVAVASAGGVLLWGRPRVTSLSVTPLDPHPTTAQVTSSTMAGRCRRRGPSLMFEDAATQRQQQRQSHQRRGEDGRHIDDAVVAGAAAERTDERRVEMTERVHGPGDHSPSTRRDAGEE